MRVVGVGLSVLFRWRACHVLTHRHSAAAAMTPVGSAPAAAARCIGYKSYHFVLLPVACTYLLAGGCFHFIFYTSRRHIWGGSETLFFTHLPNSPIIYCIDPYTSCKFYVCFHFTVFMGCQRRVPVFIRMYFEYECAIVIFDIQLIFYTFSNTVV